MIPRRLDAATSEGNTDEEDEEDEDEDEEVAAEGAVVVLLREVFDAASAVTAGNTACATCSSARPISNVKTLSIRFHWKGFLPCRSPEDEAVADDDRCNCCGCCCCDAACSA